MPAAGRPRVVSSPFAVLPVAQMMKMKPKRSR
jgi:hypothetical protein